MKKFTMCLAGAMMAISLVACTPTTKQEQSAPSGSMTAPKGPVQESQEVVEKTPDLDAPVFEMAFIYYGNSDATGLVKSNEDVEILDEQVLVDLLIEHAVLDDGTTVKSFEIEGGEKAGPGVEAPAAGGERVGTLDLSAAPSASDQLVILTAIGNTFTENFELDKLKLLVNGENYGDEDYLVYTDKYEKLGQQ